MSGVAPRQVLIVDDDEDQLGIRELLLQARGFRTLSAQQAQTALVLARREQPDCVLLDLHLPSEAEGVRLLQSLHNLPHPPPVVVLTGQATELIQQRALAGVEAVVQKGSPSAVLLDVLRRVCGLVD